MDMDQAAVWLGGSILLMLGLVTVVIGLVFINNILHKYWKPVSIFTKDSWHINPPSSRFASQEELNRIAPHFTEEVKTEEKSKTKV
jgi:Flp pilus assembly protein protease CpaA